MVETWLAEPWRRNTETELMEVATQAEPRRHRDGATPEVLEVKVEQW